MFPFSCIRKVLRRTEAAIATIEDLLLIGTYLYFGDKE